MNNIAVHRKILSFNRYSVTFVVETFPSAKSITMKTAKLTLLLCFVTLLSFGSVSTKEKEALKAIYNSTNGALWTTTWDLGKPVQEWFGVTVKGDKVIGLNLEFNNLKGEIPLEIGDLVHLRHINFFRNKISGGIPSSIKNLKSLVTLNLAFNMLSNPLPEEIGALESLKNLKLFMNRIEGQIPYSIGQLTNLRTLELYNNKLTGELPSSIGNLTKLKELLVSSNQISGKLPATIAKVEGLKVLSLFENNFFGTLPSSICNLTSLEELVISDNAFYGKLPNQIVNLTKLKVLLIGNNDFKGELVELQNQFPNLKQFDFVDIHNQGAIATLDTEDDD